MREADRGKTEPAEPAPLPSVRWPEPTAAQMTACEVLSWIAFGEIRELDARIGELDARIDLGEAYRWGHTRVDPTMAAIRAIIADSWKPDPPDSLYAPHPAWAADGRAWIEAVRARVAHQDGVPISLPRLGELLADHIDWRRRARARLDQAEHELLEALRGGKLRAYGRRNGDGEHKEIPVTVFMDRRIGVRWFNTIEGEHPGPRFTHVRFHKEEVLRLWRAQQSDPTAPSVITDTPGAPEPRKPGRPTHDVMIHATLDALERERHPVRTMGKAKLVRLILERCKVRPGEANWSGRTVGDHIRDWRAGRPPRSRRDK